ncbi:MAG: glycosyltransferase, partial [Mangrovicoccus sp.]
MTGQAQTIGLDARPYALTRTGVERFAEQIAHGMLEADPNRRLIFFADQPLPGSVAQKLPGELVTLEPRGALAKLPVDYWLARQVGAALPAHGVDVFYSISSKLPFGPVPAVTTIHGMEWWRRPESYTRSQKIKQAAWMALTRRFAARVVCFAEATRRDVSNYCGAPMAQLRLASEAASAQFRPLPAEG